MKIFLAITITAVMHLPVFSQLKKVEKTFQQGKYKKCIELSRQSVKSGKDVSLLNYYQCKSYFALYSTGKPKDLSLLDKSVALYPSFFKSKQVNDENFQSDLKLELEKVSDSLSACKSHSKSKIYVKALAASFKDTIELYHTYFPKKVKTKINASAIQQKKINPQSGKATSSQSGQTLKSSKVSREAVIQYAEKFNGIPYKWSGEDSSGLDCSGFVLAVMRKFGYSFNHGAKDQSELGIQVNRENLRQGDLVFYGKQYNTGRCKIDHVAIVHHIDKEKLIVIHCTSRGVNVQEMKANEYWAKKILFYRNTID
jgi:cell wall-associated NlpC family hydrolase